MLESYYKNKHFGVDKVPVLADIHMDDILQLLFEGYIRAEIINDLGDNVIINTEKTDDLESEAEVL